MAVGTVLKMVYKVGSREHTVSLTDPRDDLKKSEVDALMNSWVTNQVVSVNGVKASGVADSYLQTVRRVDIE